ncbi:MAG TPA: pentapeptide repeat-containing protein [Blastocatellia bacterium]|nr:pentapeptide repeat-containing protein [Blastocatellia bacterium]
MSQLSRGDILDRVTSGESLRGINLVRADLSALELAQADLAEANLRMADLSRADLREARLTGGFLSGAIMVEATLVGANLVEASMIGAALKCADLSRADLSGADLTGANLESAELQGAYLVGTYLNETDLTAANLAGAYVRMAQMAGSNMTRASLEGADLSYADLSDVRLDGSNLMGANLTGANLAGSSLTRANLRGADLTGANLTGCNLTGAKLRDIKFAGVKLADAWAEWVDLSLANQDEDRAPLEEAFTGLVGKPVAQVLIEGRVGDDVWAVILAHLCEFQITHPRHADVRLKAIHQGISSSALYLEAEHELSLAAYLAEFADIMGKGSVELFERLASAVADNSGRDFKPSNTVTASSSLFGLAAQATMSQPNGSGHPLNLASRVEALQQTLFWTSDKAIAILAGNKQIWLEAVSNPSLTLRPPHGSAVGIDLVRGRFVIEDHRQKNSGQ